VNSGKFMVQKMASGTIGDFHQGLQGRVGTPHLKFEVNLGLCLSLATASLILY